MLPNRPVLLSACLSIAAAFATSAAAQGAPAVATDSAVYVERVGLDSTRRLEPASQLVRGDRVVTVLRWYRMGGNDGFVITNPLPPSLAYQKSDAEAQEVSVDGGRTWGRLGTLRFGSRTATPEDVTHIRWRIPASNAAMHWGQFTYAGIVR